MSVHPSRSARFLSSLLLATCLSVTDAQFGAARADIIDVLHEDPNACWWGEPTAAMSPQPIVVLSTYEMTQQVIAGPANGHIYSQSGTGRISQRNTGIDETTWTFHRVPCPKQPYLYPGVLYLGGELAKNWGRVQSTERSAATGAITNQFTDSGDPIGGGVVIGYKFTPWANNIVISPFASLDFLHAPVNHTFANGSYLGTTANFIGTFGVKAGPQLDMGLWLYGIAGVSVLNETLNVNFIPVSSSQSAWVTGATVGLGGAWQPAFLQGFGRPVSLFLEWQHTWWQSANFNTPAASPGFNYNFARQDDVLKLGFTVSLSVPTPPPRRALITK